MDGAIPNWNFFDDIPPPLFLLSSLCHPPFSTSPLPPSHLPSSPPFAHTNCRHFDPRAIIFSTAPSPFRGWHHLWTLDSRLSPLTSKFMIVKIFHKINYFSISLNLSNLIPQTYIVSSRRKLNRVALTLSSVASKSHKSSVSIRWRIDAINAPFQ